MDDGVAASLEKEILSLRRTVVRWKKKYLEKAKEASDLAKKIEQLENDASHHVCVPASSGYGRPTVSVEMFLDSRAKWKQRWRREYLLRKELESQIQGNDVKLGELKFENLTENPKLFDTAPDLPADLKITSPFSLRPVFSSSTSIDSGRIGIEKSGSLLKSELIDPTVPVTDQVSFPAESSSVPLFDAFVCIGLPCSADPHLLALFEACKQQTLPHPPKPQSSSSRQSVFTNLILKTKANLSSNAEWIRQLNHRFSDDKDFNKSTIQCGQSDDLPHNLKNCGVFRHRFVPNCLQPQILQEFSYPKNDPVITSLMPSLPDLVFSAGLRIMRVNQSESLSEASSLMFGADSIHQRRGRNCFAFLLGCEGGADGHTTDVMRYAVCIFHHRLVRVGPSNVFGAPSDSFLAVPRASVLISRRPLLPLFFAALRDSLVLSRLHRVELGAFASLSRASTSPEAPLPSQQENPAPSSQMVNRRAPRCVDASTGVISPVGWSQSISLGQEDPIAVIAAEGSLNRDYDHKEADLIIDGLMARLYQAPVPLPGGRFVFLTAPGFSRLDFRRPALPPVPLQLFTPDDKELSKGGGSVSPKLCTGIKILPAYAVDHFDRALSRCVGTLDEAGLMLLRWSLPTLLSVLPFRHLLEALGCLLCEAQVVVLSSSFALASSAVLGLSALLRPLLWVCPRVTLLPAALLDILQVPMPLLAGLDSNLLSSLVSKKGEDDTLRPARSSLHPLTVDPGVIVIHVDEGTRGGWVEFPSSTSEHSFSPPLASLFVEMYTTRASVSDAPWFRRAVFDPEVDTEKSIVEAVDIAARLVQLLVSVLVDAALLIRLELDLSRGNTTFFEYFKDSGDEKSVNLADGWLVVLFIKAGLLSEGAMQPLDSSADCNKERSWLLFVSRMAETQMLVTFSASLAGRERACRALRRLKGLGY